MCSVTLRVVGQGEKADARGPGPGAEHGDPVRVSTEGGDVLLDPAQGLDLVQQAVVPLGRLVSRAQEACQRGIQFRLGSSCAFQPVCPLQKDQCQPVTVDNFNLVFEQR